jgi:Uma2 family endonuclease
MVMAMPQVAPEVFRGPFTRADYYRMAELGILRDGVRVELLDGLVVEKGMIGPRHAGCVNRLNQMIFRLTAGRVTLGVQSPVVLDDRSEPEPDVTVLAYRADGYAERHPLPEDVLLLIEAADSSVAKDRGIKLPLYARAGIREYWLVDLEAGAIEVYREPGPHGYASLRRATRSDRLTPLLLPDVTLSGSDILG